MRLPLILAALAASAMFILPPSSAQAGGFRARDDVRMWCPMDWMRRDRGPAPAAVVPVRPARKAKPLPLK